MRLTASKIELAKSCPGAFTLPWRDDRDQYAEMGTSTHREYEARITAGDYPESLTSTFPSVTEWIAETKLAYDIATCEGRVLGHGSDRDYSGLRPTEMGGTCDVYGVDSADRLIVVDWKLRNFTHPKHNLQLRWYALALASALGKKDVVVIIFPEIGAARRHDLDTIDLDAFSIELRDLVVAASNPNAKFQIGPYCRHCPAFMTGCPEQKALVVDADIALPMRIEASIPFHDDHEAADAWDLLARIDMLAKRIRSALYARAGERPIPLNDGNVLGTVEKMGNTAINAEIAYDVIKERFGVATANDAVTRKVSQAGIERALEKINSSGLKKDVMKQIGDRGGCKREMKTEIAVHAPAQLKAAP